MWSTDVVIASSWADGNQEGELEIKGINLFFSDIFYQNLRPFAHLRYLLDPVD
jgi:hypothetical protein